MRQLDLCSRLCALLTSSRMPCRITKWKSQHQQSRRSPWTRRQRRAAPAPPPRWALAPHRTPTTCYEQRFLSRLGSEGDRFVEEELVTGWPMCCAGLSSELGRGCEHLRCDRRCGRDRGGRPPRLAAGPGAGDAPLVCSLQYRGEYGAAKRSAWRRCKTCTAGSRIMLSDFRAPTSVLWLCLTRMS